MNQTLNKSTYWLAGYGLKYFILISHFNLVGVSLENLSLAMPRTFFIVSHTLDNSVFNASTEDILFDGSSSKSPNVISFNF